MQNKYFEVKIKVVTFTLLNSLPVITQCYLNKKGGIASTFSASNLHKLTPLILWSDKFK
jgi:hypothetical protein